MDPTILRHIAAGEPHRALFAPAQAAEPLQTSGNLYLLIAPRPAMDRLMDALAVRLALAAAHQTSQCQTSQVGGLRPLETCEVSGEAPPYLHILDSGNRFDLHAIARGLAGGLAGGISASRGLQNLREAPAPVTEIDGLGGSAQAEAILQRIQVARAFTCYQAEALLAAAAATAPVLAPGLLTPFADENVPRGERLRLLARCIQQLKRLARSAPVLVSAAPPGAGDAEFLLRLEAAAGQVWRFEAARPPGAGRGRSTAAGFAAAPSGQLRLFGGHSGEDSGGHCGSG